MDYDKRYYGIVLTVWTYKGFGYIDLSNNKYVIHNSRNYELDPFSLSDFLHEGDSIMKEMNSNSFKVIRDSKEYQFYLGDDIGTR
jgi:hypothetical protein